MPKTDTRAGRDGGGGGSPVMAATIAAAALIGQHVIGKATRDALFLSHFSAARLPLAMTASTLLSGGVVVLFARLLARFGPAVVVPRAFVLHASALALEWLVAQRFELAAAIVVYLHTASLGAAILSGFWSVVSEGFDPHAAKQAIGRIGGGAALGGVVGGGLAWGGSRVASVPTMLLVGAALSLVGAWGVHLLARQNHGRSAHPSEETGGASGLAALRETPYLRLLAWIVALGALMQSLLDYVLGAQAKATYGGGARLLSFFALFQTAIGVLSFVLQTTANRPALDRVGIGGTVAMLPGSVLGLGLVALGIPSLATAALQRGAEGVLRASLFRSAYEVLFTPVPQALKRPTKTVIDVSFDRLGGLVGSMLTLGLIAMWPRNALVVVTSATVLVAATEVLVAYLLHRGYVSTLAERLLSGALELDSASILDATTRNTLSRTLSDLDRRALLKRIEETRIAKAAENGSRTLEMAADRPAQPGPSPHGVSEEALRTMVALRSPDPATVREALERAPIPSLVLVPQMVDLLGWDDVARAAMHALEPVAAQIVGAILDVVLDEQRPDRIRRRAARLLRTVSTQRAADGLVLGLGTQSFDVRYACGRVLVGMQEANKDLRFDAATLFARAKQQLEAPSDDPRAMEHVFDVLSLAVPHHAMQLAYGALQSPDKFLRGVALEYLDVILPSDVRAAMTLRLSVAPPPVTSRPREKPLDVLLKSQETIRLHLDQLRRSRDPDPDPQG